MKINFKTKPLEEIEETEGLTKFQREQQKQILAAHKGMIRALNKHREATGRTKALLTTAKESIRIGDIYQITFRDHVQAMSTVWVSKNVQIVNKFDRFFLCKTHNNITYGFKYVDIMCNDIRLQKLDQEVLENVEINSI